MRVLNQNRQEYGTSRIIITLKASQSLTERDPDSCCSLFTDESLTYIDLKGGLLCHSQFLQRIILICSLEKYAPVSSKHN